jgi:hypothetical protein
VGTRVTSASNGERFEEEYIYLINGYGVDFEGKVSNDAIIGTWSLPAGKNQVITEQSGKVPGATFTWNFSR